MLLNLHFQATVFCEVRSPNHAQSKAKQSVTVYSVLHTSKQLLCCKYMGRNLVPYLF